MKINVKQTIQDYEGKNITEQALDDNNKPYKKDIILRDVFSTALNSTTNNEILTAEQKAKIYQLSIKLYASDEVNLTIDDMAFIKGRVDKIYTSPLILGRITDLFENKQEDKVN